jgi:peptidoglycan hydrolase-like protein with peptidoglycan-binding domain
MLSSAELVVAIALSFQGASRAGNKTERALHKKVINTFNKVKPHGYTANLTDYWCAEYWTAMQILAGNKPSEVPMSASCTQLIADAKKLGIWVENENCKPKVGWGVIYDWQDGANYATTDNKGDVDHVGIIYSVDSKNFYVIEGNKGSAPGVCGKRAVAINGRYVRGFIAPNYTALSKTSYKPIIPYVGKLPTTTIHYGSSGNDAKLLQNYLNWVIDAKLVVDGDFGRLSTEALLVYQKTYNLATDGFFGPVSLKQAKTIVETYKEKVIPKPYSGTMPTLTKIVNNRQKKLADSANKLAYTINTKEAKYPTGKPTAAFKTALAKLPMSGHSWSKAARAGASCDVFVWTCIRDCGIATPKRAGLWWLTNWLKDSSMFTMVKASEAQPGDIGMYRKDKPGKHGHIFMCYGTYKNLKTDEKGKVKEASAGSYYGKTTNSLRDRLNIKGKKYVYVFRAKTVVTERAMQKGDKGDNVENLQKYLNWCFGKEVVKVDGDFGAKTEQAVKDFQKANVLTIDGKVGVNTLLKMKTITK